MITLLLDDDGHLQNHNDWNAEIAQTLADTLDLTLTPLHYEILTQVRAFFATYQHPPTTRPLIKHLASTLPNENLNNQTLQQLFNTGLIARHINRIAGLPKPANCL